MSTQIGQSIVAFDAAVSNQLVAKDLKSGATRFSNMTRKSFALTAAGAGLKGRALKKAHWDYLNANAKQAAGAVAESLASGKLVVTAWNVNAKQNGGSIKFETADHFARHEVGESKRRPAMTEQDALAMLAKSKGITVEDLTAALALADATKK